MPFFKWLSASFPSGSLLTALHHPRQSTRHMTTTLCSWKCTSNSYHPLKSTHQTWSFTSPPQNLPHYYPRGMMTATDTPGNVHLYLQFIMTTVHSQKPTYQNNSVPHHPPHIISTVYLWKSTSNLSCLPHTHSTLPTKGKTLPLQVEIWHRITHRITHPTHIIITVNSLKCTWCLSSLMYAHSNLSIKPTVYFHKSKPTTLQPTFYDHTSVDQTPRIRPDHKVGKTVWCVPSSHWQTCQTLQTLLQTAKKKKELNFTKYHPTPPKISQPFNQACLQQLNPEFWTHVGICLTHISYNHPSKF